MINNPVHLACRAADRAAASSADSVTQAGAGILSKPEAWAHLVLRADGLQRQLQQMMQRAGACEQARALACSLARLCEARDHKRWAWRIVARLAAGDGSVTRLQARAAWEALCGPLPQR